MRNDKYIETFEGKTPQEALEKAKKILGEDLIILRTRWVKKGLLGMIFGKQMVEITATSSKILQKNTNVEKKSNPSLEIRRKKEALLSYVQKELTPKKELKISTVKDVKQILKKIVELLSKNEITKAKELQERAGIPKEIIDYYLTLIQNKVVEDLAAGLIVMLLKEVSLDRLKDREYVRSKLIYHISRLIKVSGSIKLKDSGATVVAFIGPTGVGKTTTIAKIAARFKLKHRVKVGLITADTYRLAAVEHIQVIADLLCIPLKVVLTPDEMKAAVEELKATCSLILIDTPGRSYRNHKELQKLKSLLKNSSADEIHLVISAASEQNHVLKTIEHFSIFNPDRIIITKLDEAVNFGIIINVLSRVDQALSYLTNGQTVPENLEEGDAERIARLILEGGMDT